MTTTDVVLEMCRGPSPSHSGEPVLETELVPETELVQIIARLPLDDSPEEEASNSGHGSRRKAETLTGIFVIVSVAGDFADVELRRHPVCVFRPAPVSTAELETSHRRHGSSFSGEVQFDGICYFSTSAVAHHCFREVTRVLVSDVSDAANAQSPSFIDEQIVDTRNPPDVKVEHDEDEDEINERFDLALFLRKQTSLTRGKRRARKFRPPDPPGSTLSTERSLSLMRKKLNFPDEIELVVPEPHKRADDPPEGLTGPAPKVPSNWKAVWDLLSVRGCNWKKDFSLRRVEKARAFLGGSSVSSFRFSDCSGDIQSEMERRTTGSGKPPTPTTATTSAAPTTVPAPAVPTTAPPSVTPTTATPSVTPTTATPSVAPTAASASAEPRDTSARKTTTASKGSCLPSSTRTEIVAALPALPALPAPLPSDYDAKKAAKGKGHAGDDRKRSSDRDDVIDVDREPKRTRARSASPPRRVSSSVFESKASARSLFSTLVFHDDDLAPINTKSSGQMMRQGLNVFWI
ncbi:hypothetical protein AALP_AA2G059200 [Arabis alpina]|uniref:Uncharacterized protein n=1 Tax=Arabis alpina TaxID=50452 RepID=A0A087HFK8_ARAAL|nr:hypothetical protein AALP_AA2G059200 [Arabis alpina]